MEITKCTVPFYLPHSPLYKGIAEYYKLTIIQLTFSSVTSPGTDRMDSASHIFFISCLLWGICYSNTMVVTELRLPSPKPTPKLILGKITGKILKLKCKNK